MYSLSGIAMTSASVNSSTGLVFQLFASLGSFLTETRGGGTSAVDMVVEKLAFGAVEATA